MVLHIISYKIITTVGIYTNFFPACLRHLVQCLKKMFSSDSMSKKKFNSWKYMNVYFRLQHHCFGMVGKQWFNMWEWHEFPPVPLLIPINIVCHPYTSHLDFQNNLYFKETQQTNATIACHLWKKTSSSSKGLFSMWKASFPPRSYNINIGKVNFFIIEQIRIIEFCPLNNIVLTTRI